MTGKTIEDNKHGNKSPKTTISERSYLYLEPMMEHLTGYTHVLPVTSLNPNGVYP